MHNGVIVFSTFLTGYFQMHDLASVSQMIGLAGFIVYMAGFAGLQLGFLDGNGATFVWTNIIRAMLVLISLMYAFNLASVLIQLSWIFFGLIGLLRRSRTRALIRLEQGAPY